MVRQQLTLQLAARESIRRQGLLSAFINAGIRSPVSLNRAGPVPGAPVSLDREMAAALSCLITRTAMPFEKTVALWRGETAEDPRPNKALDPQWLDILLHGYSLRQHVVAAVSHSFILPRPHDASPMDNHGSAQRYNAALERSLADGQLAGTYLTIETAVALGWVSLRYSSFGCVPKKDIDPELEARLIHNLSFLEGLSINALSSQHELPAIEFESVRRLAIRIEELAARYPTLCIKMLKGDVKGAFKHIPVSWRLARHFAGSYRHDLTVVDLSLPFGWTGSPAHYCAFGGGISFLVARESPSSLSPAHDDTEPFFSFVWVDDHVLIEVDRGDRLELAESALRLSMLAMLGPRAINDKKFSAWERSSTRSVSYGTRG